MEPRLRKLQGMLARQDYEGAEKLCRQAVRERRDDVTMVAMLGALQLQRGKLADAEKSLRRAIQLAPKFAKPHEDLGRLLLQRRRHREAEGCFRQALSLSPSTESAHGGLAQALQEQGRLGETRKVLEANVAAHPESARALANLARFHAGQYDYAAAIEHLQRAAGLAPGDAGLQFELASHLLTTGFPAAALTAFDRGLALRPDTPRAMLGRAYALRGLGRADEVASACRDCIAKGVLPAEAWWCLSSLRTHEFSDADIERMQALRESAGLAEGDAVYLDYALGKALDDRGRFDEAWARYASAGAGRRRAVDWDSAAHERQVDRIVAAFDATALARRVTAADDAATPVFVVGMPRSGSTLVEQILASHPLVEATAELPYLLALGDRFLQRDGDAVDEAQLAQIGDAYLAATRRHRPGDAPYFVDKQPDNFLYAGLIAMALPAAKIVDVRRGALDTCVGNLRQWFGNGKAYSYDVDELTHYYRQYRRLMEHWDRHLGERIFRLEYEMLVADTENVLRRLLEYCGLPWDADCLNFHAGRGAVTTASAGQVRQPIYRSAVGYWKNYEDHLGPLKESLAGYLD